MAICVDCGTAVSLCGHAEARLLDPERSFFAGQIEELTAERDRWKAAYLAESEGVLIDPVATIIEEARQMRQERDAARAWSARWKALARRYRSMLAVHRDRDIPDRDALRRELAAAREAGDVMAEEIDAMLTEILEADDMVPTSARYATLEKALERYRALAPAVDAGAGE